MTYELGVDVSKWQTPEKVNWRRLRDEAGVRFMFARHCYGLQVDQSFWRHTWGAMRAGIPVSGYQYLVGGQDPAAQASLALTVARELDEPYVLDVEGAGVTAKSVDTWLEVFLRGGRTPVIYCSRSSWERCYGRGPHKWGAIKLWVANYTAGAAPIMPDGWSDWSTWQFSQNGRLDGYNGAIDVNRRRV